MPQIKVFRGRHKSGEPNVYIYRTVPYITWINQGFRKLPERMCEDLCCLELRNRILVSFFIRLDKVIGIKVMKRANNIDVCKVRQARQ